ncbi:MAG: thermonuclease family protein [Desulfobacterium sp.]|jgi:endonuclease YncB( thermonuclease family)|nr:thermonuclease family protein [Desulfobacterium sp.]
MIIRITFLILVFMASTPCMGEIYQWTDSRDIKHFSNITPPASTPTRTVRERSPDPPKNNAPQGPFFKVVKVYDGDSIKVTASNRRSDTESNLTFMVRLVGIDAPESSYKRRAGQPFSREAKQMLISLVAGKQVVLKTHGMDAYNRQLAEVFAQGINVNLAMVTAGMAELYRGNPVSGLDMDPYRRAQDEAKRAYRGIWSLGSSYQSPKSWRKAHPRK